MLSLVGKKLEKLRSAIISYKQNGSQPATNWQENIYPGFSPDLACVRWYSNVATESIGNNDAYAITTNLDLNGDPLLTFRINSSGIMEHWFTVNPSAINTGMTSFQIVQVSYGVPGAGSFVPATNLINLSIMVQIEFYKFI